MWTEGTHGQKLQEPGKRTRGPSHTTSREGPLSILNAQTEHIPTISVGVSTKPAAYANGKINGFCINMLLDSGASCSVLHSKYVLPDDVKPTHSTKLTNADDTELSLLGTATVQVTLNGLNVPHSFVVVDCLSAPVILGCDFLFKHGITLDFRNGTFQCDRPDAHPEPLRSQREHLNMLILDDDLPQAVPCPVKEAHPIELDMPQNYHKALESVLNDHKELFSCRLGRTNIC